MASEQVVERTASIPRCRIHRRVPSPTELVLSHVRPGMAVLDFGCGDAYLRGPIRERGADYTGVDPFSSSADLRTSLPLPLPDASMDVAVALGVLHLLDDPFAATREIARVLKPGGRVVGYVAYLEDQQELARFQMSSLGIEALARQAGLALTDLYAGSSGIEYQAPNLVLPFGMAGPLRRPLRRVVRLGVEAVTGAQALAYALARRVRKGEALSAARSHWLVSRRLAFASGFAFVLESGPQ